MTETNHSRRKFVKGLGGAAGITSLAGCAEYLGGNGQRDDRPEEDTPPENTEPTEEPDDPSDGTEDDTPEDDQEQASSYTWEDVREVDQEYAENLADNELINRMLSGEEVSGPFDLDEARNIDISDYEEVKELLNDTAMTFYEQKEDERGSDRALSTLSENAAFTQQLIIEELIDAKIQVIPAGNDGHGFHYTKIEGHPISIVDVNVGVGRVNTGHLDGTINGQEIPGEDDIANFEDGDHTYSAGASNYQNALGGLFGGEDMKTVGFEIDLLPDIYVDLKDDSDQIFNRIKPALAVASYERTENFEIYNDEDYEDPAPGFVIHAESVNELPEFTGDNFQEYKEELLNDHIDVVGVEEANERLYAVEN